MIARPVPTCLIRALAMTALAVSLTGCGVLPIPMPVAVPPTTPSVRASASAVPGKSDVPSSAPTGPGGRLLAKVVAVPDMARPWPSDLTGVLDVDSFVQDFYLPDARTEERSLATQRGFVTAVRQGWREMDGSQNDIYLIQFRAAAGAQSMYLGLTHAWNHSSKGALFSDASVSGSEGLVVSKLDSLGNAYVRLVAVRGDVLVSVTHFSAATPDKAAAEALFQRQVDAVGP